MKRNIILIGFMGCGKTTFGKWMKRKHGMKMIDTDAYIEMKEGCSISDIFQQKGEEYFRDLETMVIKELILQGMSDTVISVGGGLPLREENGVLLKELGIVVYLRAGVDTLVNRLKGDKTRPLLQGGDIRGRIEDLMGKRSGIYEDRASLILDTEEQSFDGMYERIQEYENSGSERS